MPQFLSALGRTRHWAKLIGRESAATELTVARLMGNFILFSDGYVPVQTGTAAYRALQLDGGRGQFFSLGGDVHALFYKPAGEDLPLPDPTESFNALSDHVAMTGRRFSPTPWRVARMGWAASG